MTNLIYLTFGSNHLNHLQCILSILSFLKFRINRTRIVVVTDYPEYFNIIKDNITIIEINKETLDTWAGVRAYFWRVKIKAIELVIKMYPEDNCIYLDSDTFFRSNPTYLIDYLNAGSTIMHISENRIALHGGKTVSKMWGDLKGKTVAGILLDDETVLYNAGLIGIPKNNNKKAINATLNVCDEILELNLSRPFFVEQFSFSVALSKLFKINTAEKSVLHYWGNKSEWNRQILDFFSFEFIKSANFESILFDLDSYNFEKIPIVVREKSIKKKIKNLLEKTFPDRIEFS